MRWRLRCGATGGVNETHKECGAFGVWQRNALDVKVHALGVIFKCGKPASAINKSH